MFAAAGTYRAYRSFRALFFENPQRCPEAENWRNEQRENRSREIIKVGDQFQLPSDICVTYPTPVDP
jgi:hypothetical protein